MTGPQETSRLVLVVESLRRPIRLDAPLDKRRISPGLLDKERASAMAVGEVNGGDMGVHGWGNDGSGSVMALGREDESCDMPWRASGVVWIDAFVCGCDEFDTRLISEDLLLMADGGVMVSGTEVTTFCCGSIRVYGLGIAMWMDCLASAWISGESRSWGLEPGVVMLALGVRRKRFQRVFEDVRIFIEDKHEKR
jgi:hypothetical protein